MTHRVDNFHSEKLAWLNEPSSWGVTDASGCTEGSGGSFEISPDGAELSMCAPAFKDFWARTFYSPLLIKHDASGLLGEVPAREEATIAVDFEFTPKNQFDQAGLLIYVDDSHWVKAGIEYCDGSPRLAVVVCNVFSDWSTQPWPSTSARLRVHKVNQSSSLVVEAAEIGSDNFQFIRIAHLSAMSTHRGEGLAEVEREGALEERSWRVGPFSAVPMEQRGCRATFRHFRIGDREEAVHSADGTAMVDKK